MQVDWSQARTTLAKVAVNQNNEMTQRLKPQQEEPFPLFMLLP
jgi:hypothetical protein